MTNIKVLFHSYGDNHCPDGFTSAYTAWTIFGDRAQYIPVQHRTKEEYAQRIGLPEINKGDEVYILDFAYPADIIQEWIDKGASIKLLDHHVGNQDSLINLSCVSNTLSNRFRDAADLNKIYFDFTRSGAEIAWEYFHPDEEVPKLVKYVGDRDTWKKALPYTEEIHRALSTFPQDFEVWDTLANLNNYVSFMHKIGAPIWEQHRKEVDALCETAEWKELLGYRVLTTNTDNYSLVSDALNKLCRLFSETPFAVNYQTKMEEDGYKVKFEFRSTNGFNVKDLAKQLGGGGHPPAAGALVKLNDANRELLKSFLLYS